MNEDSKQVKPSGLYQGTPMTMETPSASREWRTVIIGIPTVLKLLAGETVHIGSQHITFIPDDVLFGARKQAAWIAAGCPEERTKY